MHYDFIYVEECFVLQYIVAPNKVIYFKDILDVKLACTDCKNMATTFNSRKGALFTQNKIKDIFGLEFQIEKEE